jgi:hypothetical protein
MNTKQQLLEWINEIDFKHKGIMVSEIGKYHQVSIITNKANYIINVAENGFMYGVVNDLEGKGSNNLSDGDFSKKTWDEIIEHIKKYYETQE